MLEQDKKNQNIFNPWKQKGLIKKAQANYILKHNLYVLIVRNLFFFKEYERFYLLSTS